MASLIFCTLHQIIHTKLSIILSRIILDKALLSSNRKQAQSFEFDLVNLRNKLASHLQHVRTFKR
jgi:hypothetical protein